MSKQELDKLFTKLKHTINAQEYIELAANELAAAGMPREDPDMMELRDWVCDLGFVINTIEEELHELET